MEPQASDFDIYIPEPDFGEQEKYLAIARAKFEDFAFLEAMGHPLPEITDEDRKEALHIFHESPLAPPKPTTLGAARMLNHLLAKYDYQLVDPATKMRNYVMYKFFELAESPDEKTSMRALENLAKTTDIGLFADRVEININQKSTQEIESDLHKLVAGILGRKKSEVVDAQFTEVKP